MKTSSVSLAVGLAASLLAPDARAADGLLCALGPTAASYVPLTDQPASPIATRETKRLFTLVCPKGCGQIGVFRNPTAPNAMTVSVGTHMTKIVYNSAFLERAIRAYGLGASLGILAHEVGHHVDTIVPPPPWMNASWGTELRADAWTGCELARGGTKTAELKAALQGIAMSPSAGHPVWSLRAEALQKGYSGCGGGTLVALDAKKVGGPARGCTGDNDCKAGRICYDDRCQERPARPNVCAKDVDCPGNELCGSAGVCQGSSNSADGSSAPGKPMASGNPTECRDCCGDDQESCSGHADASLRSCKSSLVAEPRYKECSCPRWPSSRLDCYQFCKDTYDKAKTCEASHEASGTACLALAARCVSDCR